MTFQITHYFFRFQQPFTPARESPTYVDDKSHLSEKMGQGSIMRLSKNGAAGVLI